MKITKKIAATFLALTLSASSFAVCAAGTAPGYKLVNTYDEDTGIITTDLYVTDGLGGVGQLGIAYDTELLDLGATVDKEVTAEYDIEDMKMSNFVKAVSGTGYTMNVTAEGNKVADLVNEDDGEFFFAWYAGGADYVDAREADKKIATIKFVVADGVDAEDLEDAGTDLIAFAKNVPTNKEVEGYRSGVYCANEENTAYRNGKTAKNKIALSVEFEGIDIEEETETVTIKVVDKDGKAVKGAYVKVGSAEKQTDANGEAEFEASGSYNIYYKLTKNDTYVVLEEGETTAKIDVPAKLSAPTVSAGTEKLTVSWKAPSTTNGSDVTAYIVSYKKNGGKELTKEVDGDTLKVTLTGLTGGTKYTVKVKAVNAVGEGEYSAEKTATPGKDSSGTSSGGTPSGGTSTPAAPTKYTVTYDVGANGTMTAGSKTESVEKGKYPVNVPTVAAKEGYKFLGWAKVGGTVIDPKTIQITAATTFVAQYEKLEPEKPAVSFTDVQNGTYYADPVQWAVGKGITTGTSATTFSPDATCTRAQAVTFLWRAAGSPAPKNTAMAFTDVQNGSYYYNAVLWAVENGITNGTSETTFSPDSFCTRAQIVTFLWRSQKSPAVNAANPFSDVGASEYYTNPVLWAVGNGITNGTSATEFSPNANCTRAQIVTFLFRCMGK